MGSEEYIFHIRASLRLPVLAEFGVRSLKKVMSISLREVTKENWVQCIRLKLAPEQEKLVASNVDSIAESKFEPHYVPRAIYSNEKVVGFLMYCPDETEEKDLYWLFRFMVDVEYQKQGIGKALLELALNEISKTNCRNSVSP